MNRSYRTVVIAALAPLCLTQCGPSSPTPTQSPTPVLTAVAIPTPAPVPPPAVTSTVTTLVSGLRIDVAPMAILASPWSFAILPDERALITQAPFNVHVMSRERVMTPVGGLPTSYMVGIFDIIASPRFTADGTVFLSYAEKSTTDDQQLGLAVLSAVLTSDANNAPVFTNVKTIWRQFPKSPRPSNFGGKMTFSPDERYLFITSGDRSELLITSQDPNTLGRLQKLDNNLGKLVRIIPDGSFPADNPYASNPNVSPDIWTSGHRNAYGIAFDYNGNLWSNENGPAGGDEFNLIQVGQNYGWPLVSSGNHYDGGIIAKPAPGDGFAAPWFVWQTAIAPAGLSLYRGSLFRQWSYDLIQGSLVGKSLQIMHGTAGGIVELDRIPMTARIRDVHPHPDGSLWVLEDGPSNVRLLRLTPSS